MIRKSRSSKKSIQINANGKSIRKRRSTRRRLSKKRIQINNQKGSGNSCCGCGRQSRKKRTIGPRPLGTSK